MLHAFKITFSSLVCRVSEKQRYADDKELNFLSSQSTYAHHRVQKSPQLHPSFRQLQLVSTFTHHYYKIHFNITLSSTIHTPARSLSVRIPDQRLASRVSQHLRAVRSAHLIHHMARNIRLLNLGALRPEKLHL
jgi:hypothetical protein